MHRYRIALTLLTILVSIPLLSQIVTAQEQPAELPPGGFIQVAGSQFTRQGQPVPIVGGYYEVPYYSPRDFWFFWDSTRIAHDLTLAHEQSGINAVMVRLPYDVGDVAPEGYLTEELALRIRELIQVAGKLNMRVIITLFDGYDAFPMPGRRSEYENIKYLTQLVNNFGSDERVIGWNVYYRPDRHSLWRSGEQERVISWLVRMADQLQHLAPNQLVMVSLDDYRNTWKPDFDGHVLLDHVDAVMLRRSTAADVLKDAAKIRERTDKPILLYDYGHASGPPCRTRDNTEQQQAAVHGEMLEMLDKGQVAGAILRTIIDTHSGRSGDWDNKDFYYGLFRSDYTAKLVSAAMLAHGIPALPNVTSTDLPLRVVSYKPVPLLDPATETGREPVQVEGSEHYVKHEFREAWNTFGRQYSFGMPLTEAYSRVEDDRVVQYFEAAVLELDRDVRDDEAYEHLGPLEKLQAVVRVSDLGLAYTAGRTFPLPQEEPDLSDFFPETGHYVSGSFRDFYRRASGGWRLGAPISEQMQEEVGGRVTTVQYFERGRLEVNPMTEEIGFGQLGSWRLAMQCQNAP